MIVQWKWRMLLDLLVYTGVAKRLSGSDQRRSVSFRCELIQISSRLITLTAARTDKQVTNS